MGNIADEFYDEYYATTCPECKENAVDAYEEKCTHCLLEEMSAIYNEDIALEMRQHAYCSSYTFILVVASFIFPSIK